MTELSGAAAEGVELLRGARTILLIDWPDRDVPDALAKAGFDVVADEGPDRGYSTYSVDGDEVSVMPASKAPERADIVYAHRPLDELPSIVERARELGAQAVWLQSGLDESGTHSGRGCWLPPEDSAHARQIVESAGLSFVSEPYIGDAARAVR